MRHRILGPRTPFDHRTPIEALNYSLRRMSEGAPAEVVTESGRLARREEARATARLRKRRKVCGCASGSVRS